MGEHTPADSAVEIKVKDNEIIDIDDLKLDQSIHLDTHQKVIVFY